MKHYLGKISTELCDLVIDQCLEHTVTPFTGHSTLDPSHKHYQEHLASKQRAEEGGYTRGDSIEFFHYKPGYQYRNDIHAVINDTIDAEILQSFISEIKPGKCAPWHWDIPSLAEDPGITREYTSDELIRGICFIDKPKPGQAFMIEDECFYMEAQGSIYRYPELDSWHAGFNAGLTTKFLFTFTAAKKVH